MAEFMSLESTNLILLIWSILPQLEIQPTHKNQENFHNIILQLIQYIEAPAMKISAQIAIKQKDKLPLIIINAKT